MSAATTRTRVRRSPAQHAVRMLSRVSRSVHTRLSTEELAVVDRLVRDGVGQSRSDVIRQAIGYYDDALRRDRIGRAIADSYRHHPQTEADHTQARANAIALTEAEPW